VQQIDAISAAGVTCVVSGGKFGDLYLHYLNGRGIMAVRLTSKFDLRRLARSINATPLSAILPPAADNIGHCDHVS
jgi:T-complex protein 1 subunit theta